MKKRAWHFKTISGKGGVIILPFEASAEEALMEAISSLGSQVLSVS